MALLTEEGAERCEKCGRPLDPWPLGHRACSPKSWVWCIRAEIAGLIPARRQNGRDT